MHRITRGERSSRAGRRETGEDTTMLSIELGIILHISIPVFHAQTPLS